MSEPWEDAIKAIGIKLNAAEQELLLAKKENASKTEINAIKAEMSELTKELKALKAAATPRTTKKDDEDIVDPPLTPDPNDFLSGYF